MPQGVVCGRTYMNSNKKKWIGLIAFLLLFLLLLTGTNYIVDPGNQFHYFYDDLTEAILNGESVQILSNNSDEREICKLLIEQMPKEPDCVALGPSLALTIQQDMTGEESFYNLAMSATDYYDLMATAGLMEANGVKPERIIICFDSRLFDEEVIAGDSRHDKLMDYALYMEGVLQESTAIEGEPIADGNEFAMSIPITQGIQRDYSQLFSVSYFQYSVEFIKQNGLASVFGPRWQVVGADCTESRYLPDYSIQYGADQERITEEAVVEHARTYWMEANVTPGAHMSEEKKENFERLIQYYRAQGIEVDLYLCPIAPSLWGRIGSDRYPILFEMEEYAYELAEQYDVRVIGSYDPTVVGVTDADYYDCRHLRHSAMETYFDFTE